MDWSTVKIRCSAIGMIMGEPKDAAAKKAGELSKTAKTYLLKIYIKAKYDREKDITTKEMEKGITEEDVGIKMLGQFYGLELEKNELPFENEYLTGHPDILNPFMYDWLHLHDTKLPWDIWTFMDNILSPLDAGYFGQMQGYMAITDAKTAEIDYILTDASERLINDEKRKLLYRMNVVSEESPEYIEAAAGVEINMIYPDMPLSEKILVFPIERDEDYIQKVYQKVIKCREYLQWLEEKHKSFNKVCLS